MGDVVTSSVRTEMISWKRRELAAPDSRAPLLLSLMACNSPANKLMRMTLRALRGQPPPCAPLKDRVMGAMYARYHAESAWRSRQGDGSSSDH